MQFHGVGNTNNPEDIPFGDHLRKEAGLEPLQRLPMAQMVRDLWDQIYAAWEADLEVGLEAEVAALVKRGEL